MRVDDVSEQKETPTTNAGRQEDAGPEHMTERQEEVGPGLSFPVIGIGASAGGLAAIEQLLQNVPEDLEAAFVVVQHLDPAHESHLVPLLSKYTTMRVVQAESGMAVAPRCVHVIPPNASLTISEGILRLGNRVLDSGYRMPIDAFLQSLAEDQRERAIAVILSGSGSDGSVGIRFVQCGGGFVVAQEPATAQHDAMPRNAIATGYVDRVVPCGQIPAMIQEYLSHPLIRREEGNAETGQEYLTTLLNLLLAKTRSDFRGYKRATITRRVARRMGIRRVATWPEYLDLLRSEADEAELLSKDLLIRVTSFFREPEAFEAFRSQAIVPLLRDKEPHAPIRVWVPGCASGEEAYSIAMLLFEEMSRAGQNRRISVFATDLDQSALDVGRKGLYPANIERDLSAERLARFFSSEGDNYRIDTQLRESVVFAVQNLVSDPAFSRVDIISCRNVLIYLDLVVQKKIFSVFDFALNPEGILFLGKSDGVGGVSDVFQPIDRKWRVFRHARTDRFPLSEMTVAASRSFTWDKPSAVEVAHRRDGDLVGSVQAAILEENSVSVAVVDRTGRVLYLNGPMDRYMTLPKGEPELNLLSLARGRLGGRLRTALRTAVTTQAAVRLGGIRLPEERSTRLLDVTVRPLPVREGYDAVFAVLLREPAPPTETPPEVVVAAEHDHAGIIDQLESELRSTRDELRSAGEQFETTNEELKAASEEVMSMNEELQSANEELETSKEELQSLNEELSTVNAQLQQKLDEVNLVNDDLLNLLAATEAATVFLDMSLRLRRFTPSVTGLLNLIPTDLGRPIAHVSHGFEGLDLAADAEAVLRELRPVEKEVQTRDGSWYTVWFRLYRTRLKQIDGVVVAFFDVTRLKQAEEEASGARRHTESLNEDLERRVSERTAESDQRAMQLRVLASELLQTERLERQRLAKVLHDHLQQLLVAAKLRLSAVKSRGNEAGVNDSLARIGEILDQCVAESRSLSVELSPPVLHEAGLAAALVWLAKFKEKQSGLHVDVVVGEEEGLELADRDVRIFLFEAVRELLLNVLKHAEVLAAKIFVGLVNGEIDVRVEDQGRGFDPGSSGLSANGGTGLGLFALQQRMRILGGALTVESAPGQGTRVSLRVPIKPTLDRAKAALAEGPEPASRPMAQSPNVAVSPSAGRIRLLVVDDHAIVRRGLVTLLSSEENIDVVGEASDGAEAVDLARFLRPDVIVMDVSMPKMDGVEATHRIRSEFPGTRIIGLSMYSEGEMAAAMRNAGAVAFVTKGGPPEALVSAIHAAMLPSSPLIGDGLQEPPIV
jgi:two-component system, chemotaxis family, CheB/CheR fusion protein